MRSGSPWLLALLGAALTSAVSLERRDGLAVVEVPYTHGRVSSKGNHRRSKRSSVVDIHAKVEENAFYTNITYGTPPQEFNVIFATVGNECWLQGVDSSDCGLYINESLCGGDGGYNRTASSTAKLLDHSFFVNDTGSGVNGETVTDTMTIGGATIPSMKMGVGESGITMNTMGLGYGNSSSTSLTQALADAGVIKSPAFSLYRTYSDEHDPSAAENPGRILFGGVNKAMYNGTLYTFPIVDSPAGLPKALRINMTGVSINETAASPNSFPSDAVFDVYTELTYVPEAVAKDLFAQLGVTKMPKKYGQITLPCDLSFNGTIALKFGDAVFQFPIGAFVSTDSPYSFDVETDDVNDCYFDIAANYNYQDEGSTIIGAKFMQYIYAVFDLGNDQVSLANRNYEASSDDIVEIGSGKDAVPGSTLQDSNGGNGASGSSGGSGSSGSSSKSDGDGKKSAASHIGGAIGLHSIFTGLAVWMLIN
ncbi:uncharacterized protein N7459_004161 [Penicillium hispanicum]|uniref:uncharacterized protein n=1 Tax=Penicillium hispanicum TaxID=1080232 RepID=UPI00254206DD|nr:uncharacterized protein N7459_004161 [Penicillium hispanicum]KAJ5584361.1 hypothetical protein N7459_004161 [Penicillium hispanicum]